MNGRTDGLPTEDHLELPGYGAAEPLAQGGFSTIYRVHQPQFDRLVAVKVLGFALTDYKAQRRFQRECRLAGRLSAHPNIVTVYDAGLSPDGRQLFVPGMVPGTRAGQLQAAQRTRRVDRQLRRLCAMRITFLPHALERMAEYGITQEEVRLVVATRRSFSGTEGSGWSTIRVRMRP
jgi:hypothetical protein